MGFGESILRSRRLLRALPFAIVLAASGIVQCCGGPVKFMGSSRGQLADEGPHPISPKRALELAMPHLPAVWKLRCEQLHRGDPHWCQKPPADFVVQRGSFYYVTRTAYPYKTHHAYLRFAVRVDVRTGQVLPYE